SIINAIPPEYKEWLGNKLAYSNEPSLRKRLKELVEQFAIAIDTIIDDKNAFIQKLVTTRNYLTHYDADSKDKSATGEELFRLMVKTKILLEVGLLHELGFDMNKIKEIIQRSKRYEFLK